MDCSNRKCLREVNPEMFPGVFFGKQHHYEENYGGCLDCCWLETQKLKEDLKNGNSVVSESKERS